MEQNISNSNASNCESRQRNSNIEILRIISMFMVLGLHVNVFSIGIPSIQECIQSPISSFTRCSLEMICIIAVNLFILISGWFSIKFKLKSLAKFLFQCIFVVTLIYIIGVLTGIVEFQKSGILECTLLLDNAWFVTSYIGLYILSPILNVYCEKATEKQLRYILIVFYVFQTAYGLILPNVKFMASGYSAFSFIGLYLLARYFKLHGTKLVKYGKYIYLISTAGLILWFFVASRFSLPLLTSMALNYTFPLNIISAMGLLWWFVSFKPKSNKFINFIATSVFTVYLCHICNHWTQQVFRKISREIYHNSNGIEYMFHILSFILGVFITAILLDQVRKLCWSALLKFRSYIITKDEEEQDFKLEDQLA